MHRGKTIEQVLEENTPRWMEIPGVEGTAIGRHRGRPCILVLTSVAPDHLLLLIPPVAQGYPIILEDTGEIQSFGSG